MSTYDATTKNLPQFPTIWEKVADKSETEVHELPWALKLTLTKRHSEAAGEYVMYRLDRFNTPRAQITQLRTNGECETCTHRRALRELAQQIYSAETAEFISLELACTCPGGNRA